MRQNVEFESNEINPNCIVNFDDDGVDGGVMGIEFL